VKFEQNLRWVLAQGMHTTEQAAAEIEWCALTSYYFSSYINNSLLSALILK